MSDNSRSFWSSIPGLITGIAGLLTGVVGVITLAVQQGIIGDDSAGKPADSVTTTTVVGGGGITTTTAGASFTLDPRALNFGPTEAKEKPVTVRNTGDADLKVSTPTVTGANDKQFLPNLGDCTAPLKKNAICTLKVTFAPAGPLGRYTATLQVSASGAPAQQVALTASTLL